MNADRKIDANKIQILSIKTLKGNIDAQSDANTESIAEHSFNIELETGLNLEEKVVGLKLVVQIDALDKNDKPVNIRGSYTHEVIFRVENLNDFVDTNEAAGNKIDGTLGSTLVSIAYSTVRGILFIRTQGTSLGVVTLPVVDPLKLIGITE